MSGAARDPALVEQLAAEFLARHRRGERPSPAEYAECYPELAEQIRALFPALEAVENRRSNGDAEPPAAAGAGVYAWGRRLERLGDFRILREVGRGGMGVVYEAEQVSLGRRVALKVLQNQFWLDPQQLPRFLREARACAKLHHTNIVPVYGVGECEGLNYYVMQFIQGQGLDRVLHELRRLQHRDEPAASHVNLAAQAVSEQATDVPVRSVAQLLLAGQVTPADPFPVSRPADMDCSTEIRISAAGAKPDGPAPAPSPPPVPADGVDLGAKPPSQPPAEVPVPELDRHYWQSVARIGVQVAQALAYAHGQGVLHRDIKPSNLLLDVQGTVWVTDFGLAKGTADQEGLTRSGDILGTLRYMAPERFQGTEDARCDVYSLGLTLYELLTLRAAFEETDRSVLIHRVAHEEPPPRKLNPAVPRDLETIVLKATARDPAHRYQTAQELADDLQRFLDDRPIHARRLSAAEHAWRWCRRNPAVAGLLAALLLVLVAGFAGVAWQWRRAEEKAAEESYARRQAKKAESVALAHAAAEAAALTRAREAEKSAQQSLERAERHLYYGNVARARLEWQANNVAGSEQALAGCPPEGRGWEWHFLSRLNHADLLTLRGHASWVPDVAYSPDGKWIASTEARLAARATPAVILWDAASGRAARTLKGHADWVWCAAFSPDGRTLATTSADHTIKLWDVASGKEVRTLRGHTDAVHGVAFRPDGRQLATGSRDRTVRLWDVSTGAEVRVLRGHTGEVWRVAYSADGKRLASAASRDRVRVWDPDTGKERVALQCDDAAYTGVAVSPDGRHVAACAGEDVRVWDLDGGRLLHTLKGHVHDVKAVAFSPDGRALASAGSDNTVRVWHVADGRQAYLFRGHTDIVTSVAYHPDGQRLASGSNDGTVKVWDLTVRLPHGEICAQPGVDFRNAEAVGFGADGRRLVVARRGGDVLTFDAATQTLLDRRRVGLTETWLTPLEPACLDGEARWLAGIDEADPRAAKLWDVQTGQVRAEFRGHTVPVWFVTLSRGGRRVATAGAANTPKGRAVEVNVWDGADGRLVLSVADEQRLSVTRLALSPDGSRLAVAGVRRAAAQMEAFVKVYELDTGRELCQHADAEDTVTALAFDAAGARLAAAAFQSQSVLIWDLAGGGKVVARQGPPMAGDVAFSPDGRRLAVAGRSLVKLLDAATGEEVFILRGLPQVASTPHGFNPRVRFSPDGKHLAAICHDTVWPVSLWSIDDERSPALVERRTYVRSLHEAQQCVAEHRDRAADFHLRHLAARQPADAWEYLARAELRAARGQWQAMREDLEQAAKPQPDAGDTLLARGDLLLQVGLWQEAAADYARAFALRPPDHLMTWCHHAYLRLYAGDLAGYRQVCRQLLARQKQIRSPRLAAEVALACALAPDAATDLAPAAELARRAVTAEPKNARFRAALGAALYRTGNRDEAVRALNESLALAPGQKVSELLLAAVRKRPGKQPESQPASRNAEGQGPHAPRPMPWDDLACQLLSREFLEVADAPGAREQTKLPEMPKEGLLLRPSRRRGRREALPADPVAAALASGSWKTPQAGAAVAWPDGTERKWEPIRAAADGSFPTGSHGGGYVRLAVTAAEEQIMLLDAAGHQAAVVNGEPRAGDVYHHGYVKLPVLLRQGENELLFQIGRGNLRAKLEAPKAEAFFQLADVTLPDLVVGEAVDTDAAVVVVNATAKLQAGLVIEAVLAGGESCRTELPLLLPLAVRKVGFRVKGPPAASEGPRAVQLRLLRKPGDGGGAFDTATFNLNAVRPGQTHKRTFRSAIDGSVQYYAVVPARPADAKQPLGLILTLHGAAVEAVGHAHASAPQTWAHLVAPTNRRPFGFDWEDWGRLDALEVLELAKQRLHPDPRRVYLTGHSMGGHGTWHLGVTYPDRFAAIGPSAGWVSFWSYAGARRAEQPTAVQEILQRCTTPSDTLALADNLAIEGVYVLHGDKDDNVPVEQARVMKKRLEDFHKDFQYHEEPGAGHWWGKDKVPGTACVSWPPMLDFFARHTLPRPEEVREVRFTTASPGVSAWCHWAGIEAQTHPFRFSSVNLRHDPQGRRFTGATDNVARLALDLGHLERGLPVHVELDGQRVGEIPWPGQEPRLWLRRDGGKWSVIPRPPASLKGPHRYGPFKEAFRNRVVFVYGTAGTPEENAWALAKARYDAEAFWYRGNASVDVVPDTAFDAAAERDRNVVLYGNADGNAAWKALLNDSPVQVRRGAVRIGDREVKGDALGCLFVRPRPGSNRALVGVVAGADLAGMRLTDRLPYFASGVGYPDCLVVGLEQGRLVARTAGFFGTDWGVPSGEFAWDK